MPPWQGQPPLDWSSSALFITSSSEVRKKLRIQQGKIAEFLYDAHDVNVNHLIIEMPEWDLATPKDRKLRAEQTALFNPLLPELMVQSGVGGVGWGGGPQLMGRKHTTAWPTAQLAGTEQTPQDLQQIPQSGALTLHCPDTQMAVPFWSQGVPSMTFSACRT